MFNECRPGNPTCHDCPISISQDRNEAAAASATPCMIPVPLVSFDPGMTAYEVGEPGHSIFIVQRGLFELIKYARDGRKCIVRLMRAGDAFGLEAVLRQPYQQQAVAATAACACRLPADKVFEYALWQPRTLNKVLRQYERSKETSDILLSELTTGSAGVRVTRLLSYLAAGECSADVPLLERETMAAILGITKETASREFARLRREGMVTVLPGNRCRIAAGGKTRPVVPLAGRSGRAEAQ